MRGLKTKYRNNPFFKDSTNTIVSIYKRHSQQILNMYIELKTQEEIADELMLTKKYNIALSTAKSYINKIL